MIPFSMAKDALLANKGTEICENEETGMDCQFISLAFMSCDSTSAMNEVRLKCISSNFGIELLKSRPPHHSGITEIIFL